jgi:hypothetical protein
MDRRIAFSRGRRIADTRRWSDLALDIGLGLYLCAGWALLPACAIGFGKLMQPTHYTNPGVSAENADNFPSLRQTAEELAWGTAPEPTANDVAAFASAAAESETKPNGELVLRPHEATKPVQAVASAIPKRAVAVQSKSRAPAQQAFACSQPCRSSDSWWGSQPWGGAHSATWGGSQPWSGANTPGDHYSPSKRPAWSHP